MKRLTRHQRFHLIRAAKREAWKRLERRWDGELYGAQVREQNKGFPATSRFPYPTDVIEVTFGGPLDLVNETTRTLRQLSSLDNIKPTQGAALRVRLLLDQVTRLEPAGLLFLCSRIRRLGLMPFVNVSGTYPEDQRANKTLQDAGFGAFVSGMPSRPLGGAKIVTLIEGTAEGTRLVKPEVAGKIQSFLSALHPALGRQEADALGVAVSECLENVRVHAYEEKHARRQGWYVVGLFDEESSKSSVAVLDMGVGIAASVSARLPALRSFLKTNLQFVEEATAGKLTASGQPHRGQGFRFLRQFVTSAPNRLLHVLSSSAMVTWGQGGILERRTTRDFVGTIVCLEIKN